MLPPLIKKADKPERRLRSPKHLKWVRDHHCCVPGCHAVPIEAAHVRSGTDGGTGMKPSDCYTISLCRGHHAEQHQIGERAWELMHDVDMRALAVAFAAKSPDSKVRASIATKE